MRYPDLRRPVSAALDAVRDRLAAVLDEGRGNGELDPSLVPVATATALIAVLQGGYVLARASGSADAYAHAVEGALGLLGLHDASPEGRRTHD